MIETLEERAPFPRPCPFCGCALLWMNNQNDYIIRRYGPRYGHLEPSDCYLVSLEVTIPEIEAWNRRAEGQPTP